MREILVIGIGPGHPDQITVQAVQALNRVDVFFLVGKGAAKDELIAVREEILRRHIQQPNYRTVEITDPPRDRGAEAYVEAVSDWHERRAELFETALREELDPQQVGAFLVWGDPSLYDSTLRVIDQLLARGQVQFSYQVIAGVTSIHALTTAHRIPLNRIGEPIHVTTGRRIAQGMSPDLDSVVVMLDAGFSAADLVEDPDNPLEVFWGAYLSTEQEVLIRGPLATVGSEITRRKAELREQHGWIMDTYLLRRRQR